MNYLELPEAENVLYKALVQKYGIIETSPSLEGFSTVGLALEGVDKLITEQFGEGELPLIYRGYRVRGQETPADANTFVAIHRYPTGGYLVMALRTLQEWERVGNDSSGEDFHSLENVLYTADRVLSGGKISSINSYKEPLHPQDKLRLGESIFWRNH